ncbi:HTH-type transcriptional repressor CytR [compost metagenome]
MTEQLIREHPEIDAIFASNDQMAVGVLKALLRAGKKVPEDVALIGFDGIDMVGLMEPEISTIAQPIYEIGKHAVLQLVRHMEDRNNKQVELHSLDLQLIQRATTMR